MKRRDRTRIELQDLAAVGDHLVVLFQDELRGRPPQEGRHILGVLFQHIGEVRDRLIQRKRTTGVDRSPIHSARICRPIHEDPQPAAETLVYLHRLPAFDGQLMGSAIVQLRILDDDHGLRFLLGQGLPAEPQAKRWQEGHPQQFPTHVQLLRSPTGSSRASTQPARRRQ